MSNDRSATDILLALEAKINNIESVINNLNFNIKILSNKISILENKMNLKDSSKVETPVVNAPSITTESVFINSEDQIKVDLQPIGLRRNSRPETYSDQQVPIPKPNNVVIAPVKQTVEQPSVKPIVPQKDLVIEYKEDDSATSPVILEGSIPVQQRVLYKSGKTVFFADVEIFDKNADLVLKTRTNGAGKWSAVFSPGDYDFKIKKIDTRTKEVLEVKNSFVIDGKKDKLILPDLTIDM